MLQPSPFCNINCDYCYLTNRGDTHRMSMETLQRAIEEVFASDLIADQVTFVWHAGEPLAVPISWYESAFELIAKSAPAHVRIGHSFQSNGTLINEKWCEFIQTRGLSIGLSIDGPAFIHDAHRVTRKGIGTHAQAMRGVELLRKHEIFFNVIAVITRESLDHADAIFDFFLENGMHHLGFNIEELEGGHTQSSLQEVREDRIAAFFRRLFERQKAEKGKVRIREFDSALARIMAGSPETETLIYENEQVRPYGILSVDWQGYFSTYSPELLGLDSKDYGDFSFGNLFETTLAQAAETPKFQQVLRDIQGGVEKCRKDCSYFNVCGGGAPANKYFENGSFASMRTQYCRYAVQVPTNLVLEDLERSV